MGKMVRMLSLAMVVGVMAQARSQAQTQLFLGDYSGSQVVRFSGDTPDTDVPGGNFSLSGHDEGMGGYSTGSGTSKVNHLLVGVTGSPNNSIQDWVVSFPTGQTLVNSINLDGHGALQISVANDGKSIYAAEGSYGIVQYSIVGGTYGNVLAHTYVTGPGGADANVWGVAVNPITGQVIASANWSSAGDAVHVGINEYNANLTGQSSLVAYNDHGLAHGVGITYTPDGKSFYVVNGGNAAPEAPDAFLLHYTSAGGYIATLTAPAGALDHPFQPAIGPDGNLYVSNQEGNCILRFDTSTDTFKDVFVSASASSSAGGDSAKTLFFTSNIIAQTPEPSTLVSLLSTSGLSLGYFFIRRGKLKRPQAV